MSKYEKEFMQIVKGGGSEEDLRVVLDSVLGLSTDMMILIVSIAMGVTIVVSQTDIQFNLGEIWGLIVFVVYFVAVLVVFPLFVQVSLKYFPKKRIEVLQMYLKAKKMIQERT